MRRRNVCNVHMVYIEDIIPNCMYAIFWTWKLFIKSSWLNDIKIYGNYEIIEVPGLNEDPRRRPLYGL
jgi:hypothetical protein